MSKTLTYKGFIGSVEFSKEDDLLFGEVQNIGAMILYDGKDMADLESRFHEAVDDYLELCDEHGWEPYATSKTEITPAAKPLKSAHG